MTLIIPCKAFLVLSTPKTPAVFFLLKNSEPLSTTLNQLMLLFYTNFLYGATVEFFFTTNAQTKIKCFTTKKHEKGQKILTRIKK